MLNLITVTGDDCKESSCLSERKNPHYNSICNDTEGEDLPSKQVLEARYLLDISLKEDTLVEGDQAGNWESPGRSGAQNTCRDKNSGVVEYEHDVRAEDFSPGQKQEEKFCAPRGLQGEPQIALGDLVDMETGQLSSPQQEVRVADLCLGQKTEELNLKVADAGDELPGETHIDFMDLDTEKSGQTSYHQLENITQDLTEKGMHSILVDLDPHSGRLYIPTLSSVEDQMCEGVFKCGDPNKEGILLRLYEKEVFGESSEDQEMYLLQFKEQWGLLVEMED